MKQKKNSGKKITLSLIFILFLFSVITAGALIVANHNTAPSITNAFLDKEKYFPGDIMKITVETENALEVKAFVENEAGFNEVSLVALAVLEGKETWAGNWKVENSLTDKKYKLKIVASNKSKSVETVLEWEDPNPGHPWNQIDNFPGACPAGEYINQIGNPPSCSTPTGGSPLSWDCVQVQCHKNSSGTIPYVDYHPDGSKKCEGVGDRNLYAYCPAGYKVISSGLSDSACDRPSFWTDWVNNRGGAECRYDSDWVDLVVNCCR